MIQDLGAPIKIRFKGEITNIHRTGHLISFTETLYMGGQMLTPCHTIPAESIVVVEGSPLLQSAWLAAEVSTLLVPQMKPEVGVLDCVVLKYCGLLQVHKIEAIASPWRNNTDNELDSNQPASEEKSRLANSTASFSVLNLLHHFHWKPLKPAGSASLVN
ncbi:hypothetical protein [Scytonema sp. UIC 10036]|uniref:hypothetical protein n=1 Tax=Scytonema sp. UIC 10036 TaxID=2304196 RepID=UPI00140FA92B|nr:hypothetical protein [Scytonema sp. UIC 10036]